MPPLSDWLWWLAGGLLLAAGLAMALWALAWDRLRRKHRPARRCPRCWYDMAGVPGLRCPECGREAPSERKLAKSRRRWGWASVAALAMLGGTAAAVYPTTTGGRWIGWAPNTVLILMLPYSDDLRLVEELQYERLRHEVGTVGWFPSDALWGWQWRLFEAQCRRAARSQRPPQVRYRSMYWLVNEIRGRPPPTEVLLAGLEDPDARVRQTAARLLAHCRYELGEDRQRCVDALRDADPLGAGTAIMIEMSKYALSDVSPEQEADRWEPGGPLSPRRVAELLDGADPYRSVAVLTALGAAPTRYLARGFHRDGPLRAELFEFDEPPRRGSLAIVRAHQSANPHWAMLVYLHDGRGWRFVEVLQIWTGDGPPPEPYIEQIRRERWLVVRSAQLRAFEPRHENENEAWLSVTASGIRGALAAPTRADMRRPGSLAGRLESERTITHDPRPAIRYIYRADWSVDPADLANPPPGDPPDGPMALFERTGSVVHTWDRRKQRFVIDADASDWTEEDLQSVLAYRPNAFITRHLDQLKALAAAEDPWVRAWLIQTLQQCDPSPERDELHRILDATADR